MQTRGFLALVVAVASGLVSGAAPAWQLSLLPTQQRVQPLGKQINLGLFPAGMALSSDGRLILVTNNGFLKQSLTVVDTASVNAIGVGVLNVNPAFLAPVTLAWTIIADGTTEHFDCSLFVPSLSGLGNLLTVRNVGNTRVQLSPCLIKTTPC